MGRSTEKFKQITSHLRETVSTSKPRRYDRRGLLLVCISDQVN